MRLQILQASKAEEEERRWAEEERERIKAAQAAAEEATRAAAEEAARQAAEQQRLAEEAAVRAQNLAAQRAIQASEQSQIGPTPEVLERLQRELAEARCCFLLFRWGPDNSGVCEALSNQCPDFCQRFDGFGAIPLVFCNERRRTSRNKTYTCFRSVSKQDDTT